MSELALIRLNNRPAVRLCVQDSHRMSLKVKKPPGGGSSIVFGDPAEHISLQYRNADDEPIKIIGV